MGTSTSFHGNKRRNLLARLSDSTKILRPILDYPEFRPGNIRIITSDHNDFVWLDTLIEFERASRFPLYFDTEGLYSKRSFGCQISALTFYDVESRRVLIIRINRMNCQDYEKVMNQIKCLAENRTFAVFGDEPFLVKLVGAKKIYDCQRKDADGDLISLKDMCADIGIEIHKGQTMSNWARTHLRRDQEQYAGMDVVGLLYLHKDQIRNNDLERGRLPTAVFDPRDYD